MKKLEDITFWNPSKQYLAHEKEIDKAIKDFLLSGKWVLGYSEDIEKFEKTFAEYVGVKRAVMTGSGTHALFLAYKSLGISEGDEVIAPSLTYIATIDQIKAVGAKPILVDIGEDGLIDPLEIIKNITSRTKAIVPVHLEGKVCDLPTINGIAKDKDLLVIQDAAQAIGADFNAHNACFSFYPAKVLGSIGNAGMFTTNDQKLADKVALMRNHFHVGKGSLQEGEWGYNLEPDGIQAAVLNVQIKYLDSYLKRRSEIAAIYDEGLKDLPLKLPLKQEGRIYQDYIIRLSNKENLVKYLQAKGIGTLGHNLIPNHKYPKLNLNFNLPMTEKYLAEQIRIPCNPTLTDKEVNYIIKTIKRFYEK